MNILIAYDSKLDQTVQTGKLLAEYIRRKLRTDPTIVDFGRRAAIDMDQFDAVVVGGTMWYGKLDDGMQNFLDKYLAELGSQSLFLFVNSYNPEEKFKRNMVGQVPLELLEVAYTTNIGQTVNFDKLNPIQKVKWTVMGQKDEASFSRKKIQELAELIIESN